uniref:Uncharacterized protein n=1 Tax=Ananas comosus var. bracteatus TaxID=296719 RepID=A0A6V7NU90_ANACO|nr:unnamed protein product [Ananas comosus var. bracteatus]
MKSRQRLVLVTVYSLLTIITIIHAQLFPIVNEPNADSNELRTYIVHVDEPLGADSLGFDDLRGYHGSFLPTPTLDSGAPRLVYSYRDVMSGFAARLTPAEVRAMESKPGFVHASVDQVHPLLTTYTPQFMGLTQRSGATWADASFGQGVVIGILDTGIHPTHPSFGDSDMPPPPPSWRGNCSVASGVSCNNKIIAARGFKASSNASVVDTAGTGPTWPASPPELRRQCQRPRKRSGTAAGMAPRAHLAIYKVCFEDGCATSDVLAAIDQAIYDCVDINSMSLGGNAADRYYNDGVSKGSLAAVLRGIAAVTAAGNSGRMRIRWHMTRRGNVEKGEVVYAAGGAAMILLNPEKNGFTTSSEPHVLPVVHLGYLDGLKVQTYYYSLQNSTGVSAANASITFNATTYGHRPSPAVAYFSSRGPPPSNGGILKPDVLAPGVNILAAWPFEVGPNPSGLAESTFNFQSGTSMATPHVAGIAALIRNKHPTWSPAFVHSAIITSAKDVDLDGNPITDELSNRTAGIFATGGGHVDPLRAIDPGLADELLGHEVDKGADDELPVDTGVAAAEGRPAVMVSRTATNVGNPRSMYRARITVPAGVRVDLSTHQLRFSRLHQEVSFNVSLAVLRPASDVVPVKYAVGKSSGSLGSGRQNRDCG